mmetsp:Transcript_67169/g.216683  ORF Transcript_67169/g.216683 Transcript_67169/m.216683 type:complete len:368 (+) Transcript_67169:84-1187(+)
MPSPRSRPRSARSRTRRRCGHRHQGRPQWNRRSLSEQSPRHRRRPCRGSPRTRGSRGRAGSRLRGSEPQRLSWRVGSRRKAGGQRWKRSKQASRLGCRLRTRTIPLVRTRQAESSRDCLAKQSLRAELTCIIPWSQTWGVQLKAGRRRARRPRGIERSGCAAGRSGWRKSSKRKSRRGSLRRRSKRGFCRRRSCCVPVKRSGRGSWRRRGVCRGCRKSWWRRCRRVKLGRRCSGSSGCRRSSSRSSRRSWRKRSRSVLCPARPRRLRCRRRRRRASRQRWIASSRRVDTSGLAWIAASTTRPGMRCVSSATRRGVMDSRHGPDWRCICVFHSAQTRASLPSALLPVMWHARPDNQDGIFIPDTLCCG